MYGQSLNVKAKDKSFHSKNDIEQTLTYYNLKKTNSFR